MDHTGVEIIFRASMLDGIIDQFVSDEDESSTPECPYMMGIEYFSYKVTNNLRLTVISRELDGTVDVVHI